MILEKAYYQQNFQTGAFLFAHYGLGALIEPGETHQEVYAQLKERVYAQFRADNPHLEENKGNIPVLDFKHKDGQIVVEDNNDYGPIELVKPQPQTIEEQIRACKNITDLQTFYLISRNNASLEAAYEETKAPLVKKESDEIIAKTNARIRPLEPITIENATTLEELASVKPTDKKLMPAYMKRLKQLTKI